MTITIILIDGNVKEFTTDLDYESVVFCCREMVEYNDNINQIIAHFDEGRRIFERIN